ncbi:MAG: efflux RND transporter periplasmic adaptor subunit [Lachnospirales bacterium]
MSKLKFLKDLKLTKKMKIIIAVILALVIGIIGVFLYFKFKGNSKEAFKNRDNLVTMVEKGSIKETITASGTAALEDETFIYGEADGYKISKFLVEEGDVVKIGQNIVEYDVDDTKTELENKIRDAKRSIENGKLTLQSIITSKTQAEMTKLENEVFSQQKAVTEAQTTFDTYDTKIASQKTTVESAKNEVEQALRTVNQAQTDLTQAKNDMDRAEEDVNSYTQLYAVGGVSQSELDDYKTSYDKAKSAYQQAENTLLNAQNSYSKAKLSLTDSENSYNDLLKEKENKKLEITSAQKSLAQAKQELAIAKNPLSDAATKIKYDQQILTNKGLEDSLNDYEDDLSDLVEFATSPVNGTVTEISVDENSFVVDNTVMLKIANLNNLIVEASIEEYDAPLIELGQEVTMTSDGIEGKTYTGKIIKISPSASAESTNMGSETVVPIEISVDNPDGVLKPGFNLDLEITVVDKNDVDTLSSNSILTDGKTGTNYVYKVEDDKIIKTDVVLGDEGDSATEILSGVSEGDKVIANPNDTIKDGMSYKEYKAQIEETNAQNKEKTEQSSENKQPMGGMMGNGNNQGGGTRQMVQPGGSGSSGFNRH